MNRRDWVGGKPTARVTRKNKRAKIIKQRKEILKELNNKDINLEYNRFILDYISKLNNEDEQT